MSSKKNERVAVECSRFPSLDASCTTCVPVLKASHLDEGVEISQVVANNSTQTIDVPAQQLERVLRN